MADLKKGQIIGEVELVDWLKGMEITELVVIVELKEARLFVPQLFLTQRVDLRDAIVKAFNHRPTGLKWPNNTAIVIARETVYTAIYMKDGIFTYVFRRI